MRRTSRICFSPCWQLWCQTTCRTPVNLCPCCNLVRVRCSAQLAGKMSTSNGRRRRRRRRRGGWGWAYRWWRDTEDVSTESAQSVPSVAHRVPKRVSITKSWSLFAVVFVPYLSVKSFSNFFLAFPLHYFTVSELILISDLIVGFSLYVLELISTFKNLVLGQMIVWLTICDVGVAYSSGVPKMWYTNCRGYTSVCSIGSTRNNWNCYNLATAYYYSTADSQQNIFSFNPSLLSLFHTQMMGVSLLSKFKTHDTVMIESMQLFMTWRQHICRTGLL